MSPVPLIGRPWPITYRSDEASRLAQLRRLGLRHFTALTYAHRPGMAADLTDFALDLAATEPDCVPSATFYPEEGVLDQVRSALDRGARVFKIHAQVGGFDLREPILDPVWGLLAETGVPVVVHVGSGPVPRPGFTGPDKLEGVLRRHPQLTAVVAHLGAPEYAEFLDLAERYPRVHLDTTMVFTDFFEAAAPFPPGAAGPAGRDAGTHRARQRLPEHPVPLRPPAGGSGTPAGQGAPPRRRVAAHSLLVQRPAPAGRLIPET